MGWQAPEPSVDSGKVHCAHVSTGAPHVDFYIRVAGSRLTHIHLQDAEGFADRHWENGHGTILWPSVFSAIAQVGANPRPILELRDWAGVLPSAQYRKALGIAE